MSLKLQHVPEKAIVVRRARTIVAASWFGPHTLRPFVYPFLAPGDREVTRLGHPLDPVGHSHHRSIWMGHFSVNGTDFWGESPRAGRIVQTESTLVTPEGDSATAELKCSWRTPGGQALLEETRRLTFTDLGRGELALDWMSELRTASKEPVTFGDTPFGLLGIRVARTVRVHERLGGMILNSNEAVNESGCFWQHAVWCDYSGPVPLPGPAPEEGKRPPPRPAGTTLPAATVGIACFDHPDNSPADTYWHVRDDGWMGPCFSKGAARTLEPGKPLRVRYRIESHAGAPGGRLDVNARFRAWLRENR